VPGGELALSGPSACAHGNRLPLRGDLAHIRLAGRCFVPHYAVPITYRLIVATQLRETTRDGAEQLAELDTGQLFDVLDIAGGWTWGQVVQRGEDGLVGYLPLSALERA
jgi:hypothetical protein